MKALSGTWASMLTMIRFMGSMLLPVNMLSSIHRFPPISWNSYEASLDDLTPEEIAKHAGKSFKGVTKAVDNARNGLLKLAGNYHGLWR